MPYRKKGVALIWVLVLSSVLMIISGTMTNSIIKESRMSTDITLSADALSAAQAGIEWGKKCLISQASCSNKTLTIEAGKTTVDVVFSQLITRDGKYQEAVISSTGNSNGATRKIEIKWKREVVEIVAGSSVADNVNLTKNFTTPSNFEMSYQFWGTPTGDIELGVKGGINSKLYVYVNAARELRLLAVDKNGAVIPSDSFIQLDDMANYLDGGYRIKLEYLKGLVAQVKIEKLLNANASCQTVRLDLSAVNFDQFTNFHIAPNFTVVNTSENGDQNYFSVNGGFFDSLTTKGITIETGTPPPPPPPPGGNEFTATVSDYGVVTLQAKGIDYPFRIETSINGSDPWTMLTSGIVRNGETFTANNIVKTVTSTNYSRSGYRAIRIYKGNPDGTFTKFIDYGRWCIQVDLNSNNEETFLEPPNDTACSYQ